MIAGVRHRPGCDGQTETRVAVNLDYGIEFCTVCGAVRTMTGHEARAARPSLSDGGQSDRSSVTIDRSSVTISDATTGGVA